MAQSRDLRQQIDHLVERAQDEILDASRQLADGITKETGRLVPPFSQDIERLVDEVFDFAERVIKGQRAMVNDVVKALNEQSRRAADAGRGATKRVTKKVTARKRPATKKAAPAKASASKKAPAKKAAPRKRATATRATAKA